MIDLQVSRQNIDEIDRKIVELFELRMKEANEVALYKRETGKPILDKEREEFKLDKLEELSHGDFNQRAVRELFSQIMSISRKYQYSAMPDSGRMTQFERVSCLPIGKNTKVMYYGVEGTYTQQAMEEFFGSDIQSINHKAFRGVMEAVESGEVDYGVLPIENSSTGGISDNYDLLMDYDVTIVGEHILPIDQCLLGIPGSDISKIREVYSHPQGIWQCSDYLEKHPGMQPMEFASTAECAKKIAAEKDRTKAAIASKRAAKVYGLEVLGDSIQKDKGNCTRFMVISNKKIYLEESNKIAMCIELPHESGSLYGILSHFLYNDLNLSLIQSRPIKGKPWEYRFFVDVEGNLEQPAVRNALRGIKEEARKLVVFGNFVKAQ